MTHQPHHSAADEATGRSARPDFSPEAAAQQRTPAEPAEASALNTGGIDTVVADAAARVAYREFWALKESRAGSDAGVKRVHQWHQWIDTFMAQNVGEESYAANCQRVFSAVAWYDNQLKSGAITHGDFSMLKLLGVGQTKVEGFWGPLVELAEYHLEKSGVHGLSADEIDRRFGERGELVDVVWNRFLETYNFPNDPKFQAPVVTAFFRRNPGVSDRDDTIAQTLLMHDFVEHAQLKLAAELFSSGSKQQTAPGAEQHAQSAAVPVSYDFVIEGKSHGLLPADFKSLLALNRAILNGGTGYMFCCPDYARTRQPDGSWHYDMNGLGTGPRLQARNPVARFGRSLRRRRCDAVDVS